MRLSPLRSPSKPSLPPATILLGFWPETMIEFSLSLAPARSILPSRPSPTPSSSNKQSGKLLVRSRSHADLSFGMTNPCGASSGMIGRSRTLPSIGSECSDAQTFSVAPTPPKLDPYQEWLALNQSHLEAEEEEEAESTPMAIECMSAVPMSDILTPATPPLVHEWGNLLIDMCASL